LGAILPVKQHGERLLRELLNGAAQWHRLTVGGQPTTCRSGCYAIAILIRETVPLPVCRHRAQGDLLDTSAACLSIAHVIQVALTPVLTHLLGRRFTRMRPAGEAQIESTRPRLKISSVAIRAPGRPVRLIAQACSQHRRWPLAHCLRR
jgi:hypothetical protein